MAEFDGIFCRSFPPSVLIIEGLGGIGGGAGWGGWVGWGGVGGGKNHLLGHPMSSHDAHTVDNDTPVGHIAIGSKSRFPLPN